MYRLLLCLPLCLCLASDYPDARPDGGRGKATATFHDDGAPLPSGKEMKQIAQEKPLAFLENCLRRYDREVKGYTVELQKQELISRRLQPTEVIQVKFREKPHSVVFKWVEGARKADAALYVDGENEGKMLARPNGKLARLAVGDVVARPVDGPEARDSGRYNLREFGVRKATERTWAAWKAAEEAGTLDVKFLGVKKVKEAGGRDCYAFRQTCAKPEEGVLERVIYLDVENWLQIGSVLKGEEGTLIGAYYFRDIHLNPEWKPGDFQKARLLE